ncbi:beta-lactamase class D [Rhodoligotrophos appendicifer]|nr:class D beta-lactamase [Rhodoligotrophos appendicifer]
MRKISLKLTALLILLAALSIPAQAKEICTIVADAADGKVLMEQGDCKTRVTPASTTKIALAVMGFDSGFLKDPHSPELPFKDGYADWLGGVWRQPTDPKRWLEYSVVWYSRLLAGELGTERLERYASAFGFGNADFSGDPGKRNGLERAWISSSLKVSPEEQVQFLWKLVNRTLPVAPGVFDKVYETVEMMPLPDGMRVHGKTGSAFPRRVDGSFDRDHAYGWFVGWGEKNSRTIVFARLEQAEGQGTGGGLRVRERFLRQLPSLSKTLLR